jgi:hypothetical protein
MVMGMVMSLLAVIVPSGVVADKTSMTLETPGTAKALVLPEAADHSPVIHLGTAFDPGSGQMVEGYAIVHYKKGNARTGSAKPASSQCYTYMASGAKWKGTPEPWLVNATSTENLSHEFVFNNLVADIEKWEDATDGVINGVKSVDVLGAGTLTTTPLEADETAPDNLNEVYFGSIEDSSAIAVTIVWGIFGGSPKSRQLVEWDMIFDQVDFDWSAIGEAGKMDFENIATHELGHSIGLGDLYNASCQDETMYGYASEGDTNKRTLHSGDIAGMNALY